MDDGPRTLEESVAMARIAAADGIEAVVATPHMLKGYPVSSSKIVAQTLRFNQALAEAGIPLTAHPGAEVAADQDIPILLERGELLTLLGEGRYLAIELADYFPQADVQALLQELLDAEVTPVIVHSERNIQIQQQPAMLAEMIGSGALVQVTAMSITGGFGRRAQATSQLFLEQGWVQMIASDSHSAHERPPVLSQAVAAAARLVGHTAAQAMVGK